MLLIPIFLSMVSRTVASCHGYYGSENYSQFECELIENIHLFVAAFGVAALAVRYLIFKKRSIRWIKIVFFLVHLGEVGNGSENNVSIPGALLQSKASTGIIIFHNLLITLHSFKDEVPKV